MTTRTDRILGVIALAAAFVLGFLVNGCVG